MCSSLGIMHVCKGGKISEREAKFPGKYAPPPHFLESLDPAGEKISCDTGLILGHSTRIKILRNLYRP